MARKEFEVEERKLVWNVEEAERNIRAGHCYRCKLDGMSVEVPKNAGYRVAVRGYGIRVFCSRCYNNGNILPYHGNSDRREEYGSEGIGNQKSTELASQTVGVEVETSRASQSYSQYGTLRAVLEKYFRVTGERDGSLRGGAEFPTDYMRGLASISKVLQAMERNGDMRFTNLQECGAHIHTYITPERMEYVRRYYHSIFIPLCEYIDSLGEDGRVHYFGSDWRYYASPITINSNAMAHENFVNCQHEKTIEFRLGRISGYRQYLNMIKFWRECGLILNEFNFHKDNTSNQIRLAYAKQCGNEIVELAKKYFPV